MAGSARETVKDTAADTAQTTAEETGGIASEAAASVAGTAAAVGETLSGAAGFGGSGEESTRQRSADEPEVSKTVYVGNLFFDVRAEDVKREFERAGQVVDAKIIMDNRGLSKGYVSFHYFYLFASHKLPCPSTLSMKANRISSLPQLWLRRVRHHRICHQSH